MISATYLGHSGIREGFEEQFVRLSGSVVQLALVDSSSGYCRYRHAVSEEEDNVLGFIGVEFLTQFLVQNVQTHISPVVNFCM